MVMIERANFFVEQWTEWVIVQLKNVNVCSKGFIHSGQPPALSTYLPA